MGIQLIQECKDYRERAEGLEKTIQQDRATYERNTSSVGIQIWMGRMGIDHHAYRMVMS